MDALVRAVPAGDVAKVAADALVAINLRDDLVVEVEVLPVGDLGNREAAEALDGGEALLVHPVAKAVDHVLHDAEAVVHGGGADLDCAAAEQDELGGFTPAGDATDAGDRKSDLGVARD